MPTSGRKRAEIRICYTKESVLSDLRDLRGENVVYGCSAWLPETARRLTRIAESDSEIAACFPVMQQLRRHLDASEFVARVREQQQEGFLLAYLEADNEVRAVAGYRYYHNLVSGHVLYVDDLVTDENERSKGHGHTLLDWLVREARSHGCDTFELDSGVQRNAAHRFYLLHRMDITSYHFRLKL